MLKFYLKFGIKLISDLFPIQIFVKKEIIYAKKHPLKIFLEKCYRLKNILKIIRKLRNFSQIYNLLEDQYSKQVFIRLLSARVFGFENVFVSPIANIKWINKNSFFESLYDSNQVIDDGKYKLNLFNLRSIGFPLRVYDDNASLAFAFLIEQYRYKHNNIIEVEKGDYVIDAGACWGDTALYFAAKTGIFGKVFSFEFLERNLKIFKENLNLNPNLKDIIEINKRPIWKDSNTELNFYEDGVSGVVFFNNEKNSTEKLITISIDDFVKEKKLAKIDFIKMDIEGAEVAGLLGAKETIIKYQPKLAISVYHKIEHIYKIPKYINSFNLNYKFYIDHFSTGRAETILFAIIPNEKIE